MQNGVVIADGAGSVVGEWKLEQSRLPDEGVVEGEQVMSIDWDIDGDGTAERLITLRDAYRNGKESNIFAVFGKETASFRSFGDI